MSVAPTDNKPVVAFVIEELSIGGAEQMVVAMANEFVKRNWRVHVICLSKPGELADRLSDELQLHVLNKRPGIDPALPLRLYRCIRRINPVAVNTHLWVANAWTRIALFFSGIPVVATEHSRDSWKSFIYRFIDRALAYRTYKLVSVSGDTADFYRNEIGVDDSLITIINNGIDTDRYAQGQGQVLRSEWLGTTVQSDKAVLIGTVGRLVAAKNHRRLLDAIKILKTDQSLSTFTIKLVIVGDGSEYQSIIRYIGDCDLTDSVELAGARRDIPDVLAAFDVFVLSSDREGHPLTALEAQAAGTPVVLTDAGGSGEAIARDSHEVGGVLVEQSAEALAHALREMIIQPNLRLARASFARRYALAHFDKLQMVDRYEALFKSVSG